MVPTTMTLPAMTPQQEAFSDPSAKGLAMYRTLAVGDEGSFAFLRYEFLTFLSSGLPGLPGFALRAFLYPFLFAECGRRPAIGRDVVLRVPGRIKLGSGVLIDDFAALDVRVKGERGAIEVGDRVCIGRFSTIAAKHGEISISPGANIGSYCRIATTSTVRIGESCLVGAYCYVGPGNHTESTDGNPLISNPMEDRGGVSIGDHAWLGARVTVLDGVKIGKHAIIGAHSVVRDDIPDYGVAVGAPARTIRIRNEIGS